MEDADVIVDPAEVELDPASAAFLESDEADKTTRVNVETLREFSQRTPEGKRQRIVLRFLASPVEIKGDGKVESDRRRPQRAGRGRRHAAGQGHRRARRARVRAGAALGRLHRHPDRGRPLRREARPDPQRGRPRARLPRLRPQGRPLHRRLDQARALRRDRHQQERRAGDGPAPARRRRVPDPARPGATPSPRRSRSCSPSAASATSASRTGRRSTRPRSAAASRTAARGSSSSASRRCSTRSARRSPAEHGRRLAELAELKEMIEAALPGAAVEVIDETGTGDHLRATVTGPRSSRASRGSTSTAWSRPRSRSASTTARSTRSR